MTSATAPSTLDLVAVARAERDAAQAVLDAKQEAYYAAIRTARADRWQVAQIARTAGIQPVRVHQIIKMAKD